MEELEPTPRQAGSRAGHQAGTSINISGKVPRRLYVFKSPRGYSCSPGLENHCPGTFCLKGHLQTDCGSFNICTNSAQSLGHLGKRLWMLLVEFVSESSYSASSAYYSNNINNINVSAIYLTSIIIKIINSTNNEG